VIATFQGVGSILGGLTAAGLMQRIGDLRLSGIGIALFGIGDCLWLVPSVPVVLASTAVAGVGIVWAIVALATAYQRRSPDHMQGRVSAAANMLFSVPQTISIAAGAALITLVDYRVEIVAMAVVFVLSAAYLLTRTPAIEVEPALA
jgi:MFS family permease